MARKSKSSTPTAMAGHCTLPNVPERSFDSTVNPFRARLIRQNDKKWVNGTVLHFYFFDSSDDGPGGRWRGAPDQQDVVRQAFEEWKDLGIGLELEEVTSREEAEIRIGFDHRDGSWSYVGRDVIDHGADPDKRTMNFGWDLTTPYGWDTALHEIGHTLGFPHEHQNPLAGITWDEPRVYDYFRGPPNNWDDNTIEWNILRKLPEGAISGSDWDPNSIMHYSFEEGLIERPEKYQSGLEPAPGLSKVDKREIKSFYPGRRKKERQLDPFESHHLRLQPGQQVDFKISPAFTRTYVVQTFGTSDSVLVLFDNTDGASRYVAGDDDSGKDSNARIETKLFRGREYVLRLRMFYSDMGGQIAVMLW